MLSAPVNGSSSSSSSISYGDYIELTTGDHKGKRGFVWKHDFVVRVGGATEHEYRIVLDEKPPRYASEYPGPKPPVVTATGRSIRLLRKEDEMITLRVCDYLTDAVLCHATAACASPPEIKVDLESAFGKLHRPAPQELQGLCSIYSIFKNEATEQLYRDMYHGRSLVVSWGHGFENEEQLCRGIPLLIIKLHATRPQDDLLDIATFMLNPSILYEADGEKILHETGVEWHDARFDKDAFTTDQFCALKERTTHFLLRLAAYDVGSCSSNALAATLYNSYVSKGRWMDALDICMIVMDMLTLSPSDKYLATELPRLASSLESCSKFREAASIYNQAADNAGQAVMADHRSQKDQHSMLSEAVWRELYARHKEGLAFLSCKDYKCAEETFLRVLRTLFSSLEADECFCEGVGVLTINSLNDLYRGIVNTTPDGEAAEQMNEVAELLTGALLLALGLLESQPHRMSYLDVSFVGTPQASKEALVLAFQSVSATSFRAAVCSWKIPGITIPIERGFDTCKVVRNEVKGRSRNKQAEKASQGRVYRYCSNAKCEAPENGRAEEDRLLKCSTCKTVSYCSNICQKADYKRHKMDCQRVASQILNQAITERL